MAPTLRLFFPTFIRRGGAVTTIFAISIIFSLIWILYTIPLSILKKVGNPRQWGIKICSISRPALNLLFRKFFLEIDQYLDLGSLLWQFIFGFRYAVNWITRPALIVIRGVDSLYKITWVVVPLLTRVVWPEILKMLNEIFPTATNDLFNLLILLAIFQVSYIIYKLFYGSTYGPLETPRLLISLPWSIYKQIYSLCSRKIEHYKLNENSPSDIANMPPEKYLIPVIYTTSFEFLHFVNPLPMSIWNYAKGLRPVQRECFLIVVAISAITLTAIALEIFYILYVIHVAVNGREDIDRATLVSIRLAKFEFVQVTGLAVFLVSTILRLRQEWKKATPADKLAFRRSLASWTAWLCLNTANRLLLIKIANVTFWRSQRQIQLSLGGSLAFAGAQEIFELSCHLLDGVVGNFIRNNAPREAFREALGSGITLFCAVIFSEARWEVTAAYVVLNSFVKKITARQEDIQRGLLQDGPYAILGVMYPWLI